jgi:hypothetical protein
MARYYNKSVVVDAWLFDGSWWSAQQFVHQPCMRAMWSDQGGGEIVIETLEGVMRVLPGDYVIRGVKGEFYPCKPDIFLAAHELIVGDHVR